MNANNGKSTHHDSEDMSPSKYVEENKRLSKIIEWDDWAYEDVLQIIADFIHHILINDKKLNRIGISEAIIQKIKSYSDVIYSYIYEEITPELINQEGWSAMMLTDSLSGLEKIAVDAIKIGLSDEKRACFPTYDAGYLLGTMLGDLYNLNDGEIYMEFGKYIENHPKTQKHKYRDHTS